MFCVYLERGAQGQRKFARNITAALSGEYNRSTQDIGISGGFAARYSQSESDVTEFSDFHSDSTGYSVLFRGRIDNKQNRLSKTDKTSNSAEIAFNAWKSHGLDFPKHLVGEFAIAILNSVTGHIILVRDRLGVTPLFYSLGEIHSSAATSLRVLLKMPNTSLSKNMEWVKDFLTNETMSTDHEKTAYQDIYKVPAGHVVEIRNQKVVSKTKYHLWQDNPENTTKLNPEYIQKHRKLLDQSVARRTPADVPLTVEVSGGLDSATLLGLLHKNHTNTLVSASTIHCEHEPELISLCNDAAQITLAYSERTQIEDVKQSHIKELESIGHPSSQGLEVNFDLFKKVKKEADSRIIYSGFGGDQVVTNMADLRTLEEFEKKNFKALWSLTPGRRLLKPWRFLKIIMRGGKVPFYASKIRPLLDFMNEASLLRDDLLYDSKRQEKITAEISAHSKSKSINDAIINILLNTPLIQNRFETHTAMADSLGMEVQWPLFDHELIQNFLSTPSIEKLGPKNARRYLHRRAVSDVVPNEILSKNNKDVGKSLRTISEWDEYRKLWINRSESLQSDLHHSLKKLVNLKKLKDMQSLLESRIANEIDAVEIGYMDSIYSLYSLDIWFKHEP